VVGSKSFDYGVVCSSEHQLVVDAAVRDPFLSALRTCSARVLTPEKVAGFTERAFDSKTGHLRREFVGQSAERIARATGLEQRDPHTCLIVAPVALWTPSRDLTVGRSWRLSSRSSPSMARRRACKRARRSCPMKASATPLSSIPAAPG
jgi:hypothetical protein